MLFTEPPIYEPELDMQDAQGRNMVRLGDTTDHGG